MRGRWAAGIVPRNFAWIIKGHLAVSERPGGSAPVHRRVRRQEEILWLRGQGFTKIVSLLPSPHNLHAYDELGVAHEHVPMAIHDDPMPTLIELYPALLRWMYGGERVLIHQDQLDERLAGVLGGFLFWSGMVPELPLAISAIENLLRRQLGSTGRTIATLAVEIAPPSEDDRRRPDRPSEAVLVAIAEGRLGPVVEVPRAVSIEPEEPPEPQVADPVPPPKPATAERPKARAPQPATRKATARAASTVAETTKVSAPKKAARRVSKTGTGAKSAASKVRTRRSAAGGVASPAKAAAKSRTGRSSSKQGATARARTTVDAPPAVKRSTRRTASTARTGASATKAALSARRVSATRRKRAGTA